MHGTEGFPTIGHSSYVDYAVDTRWKDDKRVTLVAFRASSDIGQSSDSTQEENNPHGRRSNREPPFFVIDCLLAKATQSANSDR